MTFLFLFYAPIRSELPRQKRTPAPLRRAQGGHHVFGEQVDGAQGLGLGQAAEGELADQVVGAGRRHVRGEPLEGAGGYTPKAHIMLFQRIEGSWTNIVGLPMERFVPLLGEVMRDG